MTSSHKCDVIRSVVPYVSYLASQLDTVIWECKTITNIIIIIIIILVIVYILIIMGNMQIIN